MRRDVGLLAEHDQAHALWPQAPVADQSEQQPAKQLAGQLAAEVA